MERENLPAGWTVPLPEHLPHPSASPALFALGVTLLGWGIITSGVLVLVGGALAAYALGHWIQEIVHEPA
jgi:hypothetical protein